MLLRPNAYRSAQFTYNRETKTFVAEMSDLDQGGRREPFSRVYDDACDEGLTLISDRTGEEVVFVYVDREYMGQGEDRELAAYVLTPAPESIRGKPHLSSLKIKIFND